MLSPRCVPSALFIRRRWRGLLCAACVTSPTLAAGAVLQVPAGYATISAAVAAATPGDTVEVAAGAYSAATNGETFPVTLAKGGLTLRGAGIGASVLDAQGAGSVLVLNAAGGGRVTGFTIQGGRADRGGGIHLLAGDFQVDQNLVADNAAVNRGAGMYIGGGASPWVHHNVFWQNHDANLADAGDPHTLQIAEASHGLIEHNLIGRGDSNGMIYTDTSAPVIRHNIFYENGTPGVRGRGICALGDNTTAIIAHNLFWANAIAALVFFDLGNVSAATANDADPNDGIYGNLDADPSLAGPDQRVFTLLPGSPAIDAGDPLLPGDPDGTVADVGPYYFDQSLTGAPPRSANLLLSGLGAAPNPFNPSTEVRLELTRATAVHLEVLDLRGRRVRVLHSGPLVQGSHRLRWDGRDDAGRWVASGGYVVLARAQGESRVVPVVLVK